MKKKKDFPSEASRSIKKKQIFIIHVKIVNYQINSQIKLSNFILI